MKRNFKGIHNDTISTAIDNYVNGRHAVRNRALLKDVMIDGLCYETVAEKYDLSVRRVQDIIYEYEDLIYYKVK